MDSLNDSLFKEIPEKHHLSTPYGMRSSGGSVGSVGSIISGNGGNGDSNGIPTEEDIGNGFDLVMIGIISGGCLGIVVLMAIVFRYYSEWKCTRYVRQKDEEDSTKGMIRISHSLPDLTQDLAKHEYIQEVKEKKVLRQTTLPTVPTRLQTFQRQLSHRLEKPSPPQPKDVVVEALERSRRRGTEDSIGLIQPELYRKELIRQSSSDSSSTDAEKVGKLQFSLQYDHELETLVVKVLQALDLPAKDNLSGSSDPYIKLYLLPDRKKKYQTKVHRRNLNPAFNETFLFNVNYEDLQDRYLQFSVFDFDRFSRHDLIGQVVLKGILDSSDLLSEINYNMDILAPPKDKLDLGELMVSLCYLPTAGRLTVTIIKARNLRAMDITGSSDPYTKVYLICQGKKIRKRKTSVRKSCLYPIWNESLVFDVPSENIQDVQLLFKVVDYDRVGHNEELGCCLAGSGCIGPGKDHWLEMLDSPRRPVAQWYPLLEVINANTTIQCSIIGTSTTSPPDSPFQKKPNRPRHLNFGCFQGQKEIE